MRIFVLMLALFTAVFPHWLELIGLDPDGSSGTAEVMLVLGCALVVALAGVNLVRQRL